MCVNHGTWASLHLPSSILLLRIEMWREREVKKLALVGI